jgi:hypothetical protein
MLSSKMWNSKSVVLNIIAKLCEKRSYNHECKVDKTYNPNSDSDVQQIKQEWKMCI